MGTPTRTHGTLLGFGHESTFKLSFDQILGFNQRMNRKYVCEDLLEVPRRILQHCADPSFPAGCGQSPMTAIVLKLWSWSVIKSRVRTKTTILNLDSSQSVLTWSEWHLAQRSYLRTCGLRKSASTDPTPLWDGVVWDSKRLARPISESYMIRC